MGSKTWCKVVAGLLGVVTAAVTGVISKSPVNYAAYEKSILQAAAKISALNDAINLLKLNPDADGQKALRDEFTKTVREINHIQIKLSGDEKSLAFTWGPTGVVYAQSKKPAWVTTLPVNSSDWYFRGEAESRSLSEAKANSLKDAIERSTQHLVSQGKSVPREAAREYAKTSTAVADIAFTYDSKAQTYRYYTLL